MAYFDPKPLALSLAVTQNFMAAVKATVKHKRNYRQSDVELTGVQVMGFEDSVVITAEMPVADRKAVELSRTSKHFYDLHNLFYSAIRKKELMQRLWEAFADIFVQRVLAMEQRTSYAFVLRLKGALERVYVGAEHQEMRAAHSWTGAPVLDASGAVAWPGREMRLGLRYGETGRLEVLPHNRSLPGEPDSRIGMAKDWLTARYTACGSVMDEVSVLEHP
jgi:hypothetical protein